MPIKSAVLAMTLIMLAAAFMGQAQGAGLTKLCTGLSAPVGMAFDSKGRLYIANWSAGRIDRWSPESGLEPYIQNLPRPSGLALDQEDRLYVATYSGGHILRFSGPHKREVFLSGLSVVAGIYFDRQGNLLVAERGKSRVLKVSPQGGMEVLADQGLTTPVAAIQLGDGSYVITDITGSVLHYDAAAKAMTILSKDLRGPAVGLAADPADPRAVYAVDYGGTGVYRSSLDGESRRIESSRASPVGLARDRKGRLYIGAWSDNSLYRLEP